MRFWYYNALLPGIALILLTVLFEYSILDISIANNFFDQQTRKWIATDSWWANELIHTGGRNLIALIAILALSGLIASFFIDFFRQYRITFTYTLLCIILSTVLVAAGKKYTNIDCPWDMDIYSGTRPYISIFGDKPDNLEPGRCFPGGHSSGGFSLLLLYFLFRDKNKKIALTGLGFALALGSTFALGQWARGAHFISHDIWSAFIAWYVALCLYRFLLLPSRSRKDTSHPTKS